MNQNKTDTLLKLYLILLFAIVPGMTRTISAQKPSQNDSVRVEDLLVKDTLKLEFTGPSSEMRFYMNGLVFLSNSKYHQKMIPDHITFGVVKAYFVPLEYISLESSTPLFINDNFPYSPAGMSFSRDYHKVYFTKSVEISGVQNVEKIFEMSIINGEGSEYQQLKFTDDPSRYLHPAISLDESYLIFSSDRTPSTGGLDLFITRKTSDGWSPPENMGPDINTSSHEWYPYIDHNNNLYFSSTGHMGYGGYDVFVCYFNGTSWDKPENLTNYINSDKDEFGFSLNPNKQMALLSQVMGGKSTGEVFKISLNEKTMLVAGEEDSNQTDISVLLLGLVESGYTKGGYPSLAEVQSKRERLHTSTPLLHDEKVPEKSAAQVKPPSKPESEKVPVIKPTAEEPALEKIDSKASPDPNRLLFRVQILSSLKANTTPSVTIDGKKYATFEYYYKGAYRITVGEFEDLNDANTFRLKCKNSGYSQSWVAAFRGTERETDPSVFKNK